MTGQNQLLHEAAKQALMTCDGIADCDPHNKVDFDTPDGYIAWAKSRARWQADQLREALSQATLAATPAPVAQYDQLSTVIDQIMQQAQVFASAWSLVGGRFDHGQCLDDANKAKDDLRAMLVMAGQYLATQAPNRETRA